MSTTKHTDGLSHCHSHCPAAVCTTPTLLLLCCLWGHLPASQPFGAGLILENGQQQQQQQQQQHSAGLSLDSSSFWEREREFVSSSSFSLDCVCRLVAAAAAHSLSDHRGQHRHTDLMAQWSLSFTHSFSPPLSPGVLSCLLCSAL